MKILFYGSKGWIGKMIIDLWKSTYPQDVLVQSENRVDYFNVENIEKEIIEQKPDRLICLLGRTSGTIEGKLISNIDYLEQKGKLYENVRDNLYAPLLLSILSNKYDIHLTYLGTGCIFSRDTRENDYIYNEEDQPDFRGSSYSCVKGFTDQILPLFDKVLNVRIRMPIVKDYKDPKSFVSKIISYNKIQSLPNTMSYLPNLLPLFIELSKKEEKGIINLVNSGGISHSEILKIYQDKINPSHTFEEVENLEGLCQAPRSNNILSSEKLEKLFPNQVKSIKECILEMFN
jgi:dTDP-4-dehydrorhamnose reductase